MISYPSDTWLAEYAACLNAVNEKYGLLLQFGIESGLRVSDILKIKIGAIRDGMKVFQTKTKTIKEITLSPLLLSAIEKHRHRFRLKASDFLIFRRPYQKDKPLSRVQAYRVLSSVAKELGADAIGPHSMRKQYAKNVYQATGSLYEVQKAMGHKYLDTTIRYFLTPEQMKEAITNAM
jgi:integrase